MQKYKNLVSVLLITTVLTLLFSYSQYFLFPNFWPLIYLGWDPHMFRAVGTFFDPTTSGSIFILLGLTNFFLYKKNRNYWYLAGAILFIPLFFLTYSRVVYIMLIATVLYLLFINKKMYLTAFAVVLFVSILLILPRPDGAGVRLERMFSINSRLIANREGVELFRSHPLLGVGFNRIRYARGTIQGKRVAGNAASGFPSSFITVLASMGTVGLVSFLFLFFSLWNRATLEGKTLLTAVFTGAVFENIFFVSFVFLFFALCFSVFTAHRQR